MASPSDLGAPRTQLDGADDQDNAGRDADPRLRTGNESTDVEKPPNARRRPNGVIVYDGGHPSTAARIVVERKPRITQQPLPDLLRDHVAAEKPALDEDQCDRRQDGPQHDGTFGPSRHDQEVRGNRKETNRGGP